MRISGPTPAENNLRARRKRTFRANDRGHSHHCKTTARSGGPSREPRSFFSRLTGDPPSNLLSHGSHSVRPTRHESHMRTALAPRAERMVAPLAVAIGSVLLAGIVALALDQPVPTLAALLVLCTAIAVIRFPNVAMMALLFVLPFHAAIFTALANRAHVSADPLIYWKDVLIGALFARAVAERVLKDRRLPIRNAGDNALLAYVFAFIVIALASPGRPTVGPALGRYIEGPLL